MGLTPEERERQKEIARVQFEAVKKDAFGKMMKNMGIGCLVIVALLLLVLVMGAF